MTAPGEREALTLKSLNWWAKASYMASVAALCIAALAFGYGAYATHETQEAQTQALAVTIYQEYSKLSLQYPEFANWPGWYRSFSQRARPRRSLCVQRL